MMTVAASEGINILRNTPSILTTLQENVRAVRAILDKVDYISIPTHPASAVIHINVRPAPSAHGQLLSPTPLSPALPTTPMTPMTPMTPLSPTSAKLSNPTSVHPRHPPHFDIEGEERLLQDIVDDALAQGVLITRAKRLRGQELIEARPSIRLAISAAMSKKDCEKAANVIKASCVKVLGKRR